MMIMRIKRLLLLKKLFTVLPPFVVHHSILCRERNCVKTETQNLTFRLFIKNKKFEIVRKSKKIEENAALHNENERI